MDIEIFYIEKGHGEPLILLHGNSESSSYFDYQIEEFAEYFHVFAIDTRGHGKTPRGSAPFTIRQFSDDLKCFMNEHDIKKANILGFSDGANIAIVFALKYPEMVNKLVLNGANLNPGGVKAFYQLPCEALFFASKMISGLSKKALRTAEMMNLMIQDPNIKAEELEIISAETLVIAGTKDMIKQKHTEMISSHIKNSVLVFVEGDHFIANKNPVAFNRKVLSFLY